MALPANNVTEHVDNVQGKQLILCVAVQVSFMSVTDMSQRPQGEK